MLKNKRWDKISIFSSDSDLENISAYFKHIMLGAEQTDSSWNLFFEIENRKEVLDIILELKSNFNFTYSMDCIDYDDWHLKWKDNFGSIQFGEELIVIPDWDDKAYNHKNIIKMLKQNVFGLNIVKHHGNTSIIFVEIINFN